MATKKPKSKKQTNTVLVIVSRSGNKEPRIGFYDKGKTVSKDKIDVTYRNPESGRFVTKRYPIGRDSKTGEFISRKDSERRPNSSIVERIPKDSPLYFRKNSKKR